MKRRARRLVTRLLRRERPYVREYHIASTSIRT
jgi:hypothetical protein